MNQKSALRAVLAGVTLVLSACGDDRPLLAPEGAAASAASAAASRDECVPSYEATCYTDAELVAAVRAHQGRVFIGVRPVGFPSAVQAARAHQLPRFDATEWQGRLAALRAEQVTITAGLDSIAAVVATIRPEDAPRLRRLPFVWYIEPQYQRCIIAPAEPLAARGAVARCGPTGGGDPPTEPSVVTYSEAFGDLRTTQIVSWAVSQTNVNNYGPWWEGYRGQGMTVGVIDGEVMITHPELSANFVARQNYTTEAFGNPDGHATWVAGAIVAPDNGIGTVGVAPEARYYNAKVCTTSGGSCTLAGILNAVDWLSGLGVPVVNMSLGGANGQCSLTERNRLQQAVSRGTVVVVAAGENSPVVEDHSPYGCYDGDIDQIPGIAGLISVSSHDIHGWPARYSWYSPNRNAALFPSPSDSVIVYNARNPGPSVAAGGGDDPDSYLDEAPYSTFVPGRQINSTCADYNGDGYAPCEGTSMAAPIVAGLALVRKQKYTGDRPFETEYAVYQAAVVRGWYCSSTNPCPTRAANYGRYGAGRAAVNW